MCTLQKLLSAAFGAALLLTTGCGMPGVPQPPSLNLADPVTDLSATRAGNQVTLTWTMPKRSTDKLLLKDKVAASFCLRENIGDDCISLGDNPTFPPAASASVTEILPEEFTTGPPRPLCYFVELRNHHGRSAGPSNAAIIVAGAAPAAVTGLTAEARKQGVLLGWNSAQEANAVRLHRRLLTPQAKPRKGLLAPSPEPSEVKLLVERGAASHALDKAVRVGQSYEYRAQRVVRVPLNGKTLELTGELSDPVRVELHDNFPPEVPGALAAVAITGDSAAQSAIDLSWQPVLDANLAGYIVYRREGDAPWQRISPAKPLPAPAFHDAQVQQGHTYRYAVSALAQNGHESPRSAETEETVPNP